VLANVAGHEFLIGLEPAAREDDAGCPQVTCDTVAIQDGDADDRADGIRQQGARRGLVEDLGIRLLQGREQRFDDLLAAADR
jgi:hypothetical protein